MTPKNGDRIIIENVPNDYEFKDLYKGLGTIQDHFGTISENGIVPFFTGYAPYKLKEAPTEKLSCSGVGHSVPVDALCFDGERDAPFWQFKDGIMKAHNGETYYQPVAHWKVDFKDCR